MLRGQMGRDLRRSAQKTVFDARQRLTSSSGTRASFDFDLLDEYAGSRLSGAFAVPLLLVILGLFSSLWVAPVIGGVWVVAGARRQHGASSSSAGASSAAPARKVQRRQWTASFVAAETAYGICWSLLSLFTLVGDEQACRLRCSPWCSSASPPTPSRPAPCPPPPWSARCRPRSPFRSTWWSSAGRSTIRSPPSPSGRKSSSSTSPGSCMRLRARRDHPPGREGRR